MEVTVPTPEYRGQPAPEQDLRRIATEANRLRELPEHSAAPTHEVLRESLRTLAAQQAAAAPAPTPPPAAAQPQPGVLSPALVALMPDYVQKAPLETQQQVAALLTTTMREGVDAAHARARNAEPFIIDAFHDMLAGTLHDELERRGMLS